MVSVFYRSPASNSGKDLSLFNLIDSLRLTINGNLLFLGDFNWPNIDWTSWTTSSQTGSEIKFIVTLRKNFLTQHVSKPARARGDDEPHTLDLVLSNEQFIENITILAPIGKSDHSLLSNLETDVKKMLKYNYNKGDYDGMRKSFQIGWKELFTPYHNKIENGSKQSCNMVFSQQYIVHF